MPIIFNSSLFNASLFNGEPIAGVTPPDDIVFNGYGLQNSEIISSLADHDSAARREIRKNRNPREDGMKIETDNYRAKVLSVRGVILKSTVALLEDEIDQMKKYLSAQNGQLEIRAASGLKRIWDANVINFDSIFSRDSGDITRAPYSIRFECLESFGRSEDRQIESATAVTSATKNYELWNGGSYKTKPIFTIAFDAASAVSKVNIKNNTTGKEIEITRTFAASELLEVNGETKEVTVDSSAVDFDGFFFDLETGANSITITLTSTSHSYTLSSKFYKNYL